jgi:xylulokinase
MLLGIDLGTSSVKVSVVDPTTFQCISSARYPETENEIISQKPGWAEQSPDIWWEHVQLAILKLHVQRKYNPKDITAIGIAYQMHGLVMIDKEQKVLRNSIIWCDSRAVELGDQAFEKIGKEKCLLHLLNSPGNFTASKLAWVKQNEPKAYEKAHKIMLPGDFIAMKLTGEATTSIAALSEGVFWDFQKNELSKDVFAHYQLNTKLVPTIKNVFTEHGKLTSAIASALSLKEGIPVTYKAGDQPNNALSLNVMQPGEVAATAGTSGVIYGVSDQLAYDNESRVNTFAHVNYTAAQKRLGVLLCVNGTGILNRWMKNIAGSEIGYDQINNLAKSVKPGSEGVTIFPFGNGAERMLNNKIVGAAIQQIDFNKHTHAHLFRAAQEGIAFALRYGLDIMRGNGMNPKVIRAGKANMFLSEVFTQSFANVNNVAVEFYEGDGSMGAAIGAGIGAGVFSDTAAAKNRKPIDVVKPTHSEMYNDLYQNWKEQLNKLLSQAN